MVLAVVVLAIIMSFSRPLCAPNGRLTTSLECKNSTMKKTYDVDNLSSHQLKAIALVLHVFCNPKWTKRKSIILGDLKQHVRLGNEESATNNPGLWYSRCKYKGVSRQ